MYYFWIWIYFFLNLRQTCIIPQSAIQVLLMSEQILSVQFSFLFPQPPDPPSINWINAELFHMDIPSDQRSRMYELSKMDEQERLQKDTVDQ